MNHYRIGFDGSLFDEKRFTVIGGRSESVLGCLRKAEESALPNLREALNLSLTSIEQATNQTIAVEGLEVAILDRKRSGRKFKRLSQSEAGTILS